MTTSSIEQQVVVEERQLDVAEIRLWKDAFHYAAIGMGFSKPLSPTIGPVNEAYAAAHGMSVKDTVGKPIADFYAEHERHRLSGLLAEADRTGHVAYQACHLRTDGSTFPVEMDITSMRDAHGAVLYRVGTMTDITERRRAEEALRQAVKMEAIGNLTGGMAHDFNNLLAIIILNLDLALSRMTESDGAKQPVGNALAAARYGESLIRNLLAFARRQPLHPVRADINDQVSSMHQLLSSLLGEDIEIVLDLAPDIWTVIVDPPQTQACIINLATNARDAMPKGGRLTITTNNQRIDTNDSGLNPSVKRGDYATITVSDTGSGMAPDTMAKAFDPFFTTKEVGRGTGLGLSMVFGFAHQSGGDVAIDSKPGIGTTVRMFLPRSLEAAHPIAVGLHAPSMTIAPGRGEVILVVEDNELLRLIVAEQLAELNYAVIQADNGGAALTLLGAKEVNLVFSDVMMPGGMDGFELAEQVRSRWPKVKVLLTSGLSYEGTSARFRDFPVPLHCIGKPFEMRELASALRAELDA